MFFERLRWVLPLLLLFAVSAKADSVYVNGSYAFADHGYGIGPYGGTLNGQSTQFYCVDFLHSISGNTGWNAAVTGLTNATGYASTRLNNQTTYLEIAYLLTQMMAAPTHTLQAEYQWAIWSFSGGGDPYGTNSTLDANALFAVQQGFTVSGWVILTPTGTYGQEFIVPTPTPEPGTLALLCAGLLGMILLTPRKRLA